MYTSSISVHIISCKEIQQIDRQKDRQIDRWIGRQIELGRQSKIGRVKQKDRYTFNWKDT